MTKRIAVALSLILVGACAPPAEQPQETTDWEPRIRDAHQALLNEGNLERVSEFFSESYVSHGADGDALGRNAIRSFVSALRTAFPDLQVEIQVLVIEGNRVAWLRTHRGTHSGEFMGVASSGEELTWKSLTVTRYEDGMITEEWMSLVSEMRSWRNSLTRA